MSTVPPPARAARAPARTAGRGPATATADLAAYRRPVVHRSRTVRAGVMAAASVVCVGVPVAVSQLVGSTYYERLAGGYPGPASAAVAAGARAVTDAAGCVSVGALVVLLFLTGTGGRGWRDVEAHPEMRLARGACTVWAVMALLMIPVDAADRNGAPVTAVFGPGNLAYLTRTGYMPGAWMVASVLVGLAAILLWFAWEWANLLLPAGLAAAGLLAPVVVDQVLVGPDHDYASDAVTFQTLAAAVLFGVCMGLAWRTGRGLLLRPVTLRRAWVLSASCWVVVAGMDLILTGFKLSGPQPWANPTWIMTASRDGVLLAAGVLLACLWRWGRAGVLTDRRIRAVLLAGVVLAAGWVGVTAGMVRVPPPVFFARTSVRQLFFGYNLPQAPTFTVLSTQWRPNILFLGIAAAAVGFYLAGVVRLARRGHPWPARRTAVWTAGWAVVTVATSSGLGKYAGADFAVHMTDHMSINMLAPLLLVLGGPVTLLLAAARPAGRRGAAGLREWAVEALGTGLARAAAHPLRVFVEYVAAYYVLYLTPLFGTFIRYHWAHRLMQVEFLLVGYLFFAIIIGVDRPPRPLPQIGKLGYTLAAMPFHAFFGVIMMMAATPVADQFYRLAQLPWAHDLEATQRAAGVIAWAGGELPFLAVVAVLAVQWMRQDRHRAAPHAGRSPGLEDADYDRLLDRLEQRAAARRPPQPAPDPSAPDPAEEPR